MKTKLLFFTFIFMASSFQLIAQTITWDGGAATTTWSDAANWDGDVVPGASNDVDLDGNTVVLTGNTTVQRVYAGGSSNLTINSGVTLTITGFSGGDDGLEIQNSATVINNGTIAISNIDTANTDADGLYNKGTFTNNGAITIDGTGQHGIYLQQGTFTNNATGTITITNVGGGDTSADYLYMDDNGGTPAIFHNYGDVDITMTGIDDGIYVRDGSALTNHSTGTIDIISTGGGDMPLHVVGLTTGTSATTATTLTNAGTITITGTNTTDYGIQVDGNDVTPAPIVANSGTLTVQNTPNDAIRIRKGGTMTNSAGGVLNITNPGDEGIQIDAEANTVFNNSGTVNITGDNANSSNHGIELLGTFNNLSGSVLTVTSCGSDGMRIQASGVFANDGDINMYGSIDNDIELTTGGSFTNSGTATFSPGSKTASTYGVTNIKKDFDLGSATITFQIGGTTAGTEYDQIENKDDANTITITSATAHLDWGTYVPNVGDEFKIMDESGTVSGPFASVTSSNADIIYTVDYTNNTDEVKIIVTGVNSTWTGNTDNNWSTVGNWSTIVPTATTDVIIPSGLTNYPTATGAVTTNSITMASGTSFIANSSVTGNITYNLSIPDANWHLVSSPVNGETYDDAWVTANSIASGSVSSSNRGIATYQNGTPDGTTGPWIYMQGGATAATFDSGTGYSMIATGATTYGFTGTYPTFPNQPAISQDVNNWNLVGNPAPAYIDVAAFITANSGNLGGAFQALYVYYSSGGGYTGLTSGYIHPAQAFFVSSNVTSGTLSTTAAMLSHQTGVTFYKENKKSIELSISDGSASQKTLISYENDASLGLDIGSDIGKFNGVNIPLSIYTNLLENNENIAFEKQVLPDNDYENMIVPIGVRAETGNEITFSAEVLNLPEGIEVYLEDRLKNTYTRLDEANAAYKVTLTDAVDGVGRFYLHTSSNAALSIDDNVALDNISIYKSDASTLRIVSLQQGNTNLKIFNVLGKQVMNTTFNTNGVQDIPLPKVATGVYIVQLETNNGKLNKKIILE
ncbi:T9SS type A sorting domain-containing protein [uncultured Polaribacter sp.]|uniref:beta strand repeat-containing protein n=1 Tax=uncultured Polaribacter sp. TaxID=174711 RepID=UPI00262FB32A|nr:T9SS type A sorting domain-containing protein [uncultured Polaribacter sp.]